MRKLVFCFWLALVFPVAGTEIKFNFGDFSQDQPLTKDFSSALAGSGSPGQWKVVTDEMPSAFAPLSSNAPAMNHVSVLSQQDADPNDGRFPMLVYDKEEFGDFQLTTRFKIVGGAQEQMAGIVFRFQNTSNFYVMRISALGHNLRFYKFINGQFVDPTTVSSDISAGTWHTLTLQSQGNQINCWVDERLAMPLQTAMTLPPGKVGFWTMADSLTHYGPTTITYTPKVPMAQLMVQKMMEDQPRLLDLKIYTLDKVGMPRVIASKEATDLGLAGTASETGAITNGATFFGRGKGTVNVTMPLTDRNGDPIAAVRVQLKSFLGETRDNALIRARYVVQAMQSQILSSQDLSQ